MRRRHFSLAAGAATLVAALLGGCTNVSNIFNPDFLTAISAGETVSSLPGEAPGLLVQLENKTTGYVRMVVSYRDIQDNVRNYTSTLGPGDSTGQMLVCPIEEITLGSVTDLNTAGAIVYLGDLSTAGDNATLGEIPYIEVDPFGVLLVNGLNYSCGDGIDFLVLETPGQTRSGYRIRAVIDHAQ